MAVEFPRGKGWAFLSVDGADELLSRLSTLDFADEAPNVVQPDDALDGSVGEEAASVGSPRLGTVQIGLDPVDGASPAVQAWEEAVAGEDEVTLKLYYGTPATLATQASGANATTVLISKTDGTVTVAAKGSGNPSIPASFGTSEEQSGPFWKRGQIIVQGGNAYHVGAFSTATKRKVSLLGPVAADVVTKATATEKAADWSVSPASDVYTVRHYGLLYTVVGRPLSSGDLSISATNATWTASVQLSSRSRQYALAPPTY